MTTETEKLKKRLKFMNKELKLRRHKLKRHTQDKEVKSAHKKTKSSQKLSDINDEFSSTLETSSLETNNCNISIGGKYDTDFLSTLSDHFLNNTVDSKDDVLMTINSHDMHTASQYEVMQNNSSTEKDVTLNAVDPELASSEFINVLGKENPALMQSEINKEDFVEHSTYSTPKKSMIQESNSDLSPILLQRNGVTSISAKPKERFLVKRMKGLVSSTKSKRKDFLKEFRLTLNHDIVAKVKTSGVTLPSDIKNSENITNKPIYHVVPFEECTVPREAQRNVFVTFPSCSVEGQILAAFFEDCVLVLVQELQISFWRILKRKEPPWFHIGLLPRKQLHFGISVGCQGGRIDNGSEQMFICSELWTSDEQEHIILSCVIYSYNTIKAGFKSCCLELTRVPQFIKNIKFCVVPEFSIVVSWQHHDDVVSTVVAKFSIDIESNLILKSTQLVPVMETVNSVLCLKGCRTVVIGDGASQIFLWNHCTGALVTAIQFPQLDTKLQWGGEDQGFLFAAVTSVRHAELIAVNLTTGKQKRVRQYLLPEANKLFGINVQCGKMIAVFLEGLMCWELVDGTDTTQKDTGQ